MNWSVGKFQHCYSLPANSPQTQPCITPHAKPYMQAGACLGMMRSSAARRSRAWTGFSWPARELLLLTGWSPAAAAMPACPTCQPSAASSIPAPCRSSLPLPNPLLCCQAAEAGRRGRGGGGKRSDSLLLLPLLLRRRRVLACLAALCSCLPCTPAVTWSRFSAGIEEEGLKQDSDKAGPSFGLITRCSRQA